MASDNHASFARIGFAVVLGVIAIFATLVYIGGLHGGGDELFIETYYDKPVYGLAVGSSVNFRGVKVGEVREISFVGAKYHVAGMDNQRIYILMSITRQVMDFAGLEDSQFKDRVNYLVSRGLRATVTSNGITGLARIECDFSQDDAAPISWRPNHAFIPPKISLLDNFTDSATKVMRQINAMDIQSVWSNIHFSVESLAQITESMNNLLDSRRPELGKLMGDLSDTAAAARELVEKVRDDPSLLLRGNEREPLPETRR